MKKKDRVYTVILLFVMSLFQLHTALAQRKLEKLDRGLVAVQTNNGVFLSWRVFGTDAKDVAFNVYRNKVKLNASPITGATNMIDALGSANAVYSVNSVLGGVEQNDSTSAAVWASQVKAIHLSNRPSSSHAPNDINVGDLDGDGQYELVVKWYPANAKDNSQSGITDNTYLAAYQLDGTFMWIIDLGKNIRSGAHYTQHLVGDYNSDGFAEVACKTAPGTKDGEGNFLSKGPAASDDDNADYRNGSGYVLSGPEYVTIFNGKTGEEMATVNYLVARGSVSAWGDGYGNRVDRFNATNAYLDGVKPSMVFQRGYYTRMVMAAFDWDGTTLTNKWLFDSNNAGNGNAFGQGNHSIMAADVDDDGKDELLTGSACIDNDGKFKWATGFGHGDANHVGDFDVNSLGLEVWQVSENKGSEPDHYMIKASDGSILWRNGSGNDNGRGMVGDIDARYPGQEAWSNSVAGTYTASGVQFTTTKPSSANFRIYWDGDLQDELLNNTVIDKWNGNGSSRLLNLTGQSCNGTKATPNLSADILGDWREEVILHDGVSTLYIHTTTIATSHKLYTLMHDPIYRNAISWQQSSYNQPPHLGFFLGAGVDKAPTPNISLVGAYTTDCNGVINGTAFKDNCNTCVGGNTGKIACVQDCKGVWGGTTPADNCGACLIDNTIKPCTGSIEAEDACAVDGVVLENINTGFSGDGYVNTTNTLGAQATWMLSSNKTQTATLSFRYANGGTTSRDATISINGKVAGNLILAPTGDWSTWKVRSVTLNMVQGENKLVLVAITADGLANLDLISFSDGISEANCVITGIVNNKYKELEVYPNPTTGKLTLNSVVPTSKVELLNTLGEKLATQQADAVDLTSFSNGIYFLKIDEVVLKVVKY